MPAYRHNGLSFILPESWTDHSVLIFASGGFEANEFSFVINQESIPEEEDVEAYAARQIRTLESNLHEFRLIEQGTASVGERYAMMAEFTWTSQQGLMHQRQYYLYYNKRALTLTGTALEPFFVRYRNYLSALIDSFKFERLNY